MAHRGRENADPALIAAIASGLTAEQAGERAGVSVRTVHRRLSGPAFRQEVADARAAMVDRAVGQMADAATAAASTLRTLLGAEAESVRLGAARSIIELGARLREEGDLAERLRRLEEVAERLGASGPAPVARRVS